MRGISGWMGVLALAGCTLLSAFAQQAQRRDYLGLAHTLFLIDGVAEELELPTDKFDNAEKAVKKVTEKYLDELNNGRRMKESEAPVYEKVSKETNAALAQILTVKQMNRLAQIQRQRYFWQTMLEEGKSLKLSADQRRKIENLTKYDDPGTSAAERKSLQKKALSLLTPEQMRAWEALVGPPFPRAKK